MNIFFNLRHSPSGSCKTCTEGGLFTLKTTHSFTIITKNVKTKPTVNCILYKNEKSAKLNYLKLNYIFYYIKLPAVQLTSNEVYLI